MIKILKGTEGSAMYDEATEIFFGPLFAVDEDPMEFLDWINNDPKQVKEEDLLRLVNHWRTETENDNEAKAERFFSDSIKDIDRYLNKEKTK